MPWCGARAVLVLCLLLTLSAAPFAAAAEFADVPTTFWAWPFIQGVNDAEVAQGYPDNTYRPEYAVTRDQMAVYIARALTGGDAAVPTGPATPAFTDVEGDHWAYRYIEYCADQNVVQGYPGGAYRPTEAVNRGQMAVYIARAMVSPTGDAAVPDPPADGPTFPDVTPDNEWEWCYQHVEFLAGEGVVTGYWDGSYRPGVVVTRAQMAVFICRAFDLAVPTASYDIADYFPLVEGNSWVYEGDGEDSTLTVSGTVEIGDDTYLRLLGSDGTAAYFLLDDAGLHFGGGVIVVGTETMTVGCDPVLSLPRVLSVGDTATLTTQVSVNGSAAGEGVLTYEVIGVEPVTVPAGTFANCLKLELQLSFPGADEPPFFIWLASGIGPVKLDSRPFGGTTWSELVAASIGGVIIPAQSYHITDYWPLNQGDSWTYSRTGDGWSDTVGLTISGTTTLEGQVYSNLTRTTGGQDVEYWREAAEGLYFGGIYSVEDSAQFVATPAVLFPNSLSLGESVSGTVAVTLNGVSVGTMPYGFSFLGIETVMVPAGTFPYCMKIEFTKTPPGSSDEEVSTYWLASGVGTVKRIDVYPGDDTENWQLTSATVGGNTYP